MAAKRSQGSDRKHANRHALKPAATNNKPSAWSQHPASIIQRTQGDRGLMSARDVIQLQRTIGNKAVGRLLARPSGMKRGAGGGLPDLLRAGVEELSGQDLSDVKVHYNSAKPAQLNALAYTQGKEIHVGPGQERHLPHEAWHAVQQAQGRVKPGRQYKRATINEEPALEREATAQGTRALQRAAQRQRESGTEADSAAALLDAKNGLGKGDGPKRQSVDVRLTTSVEGPKSSKAVDEEPREGKWTATKPAQRSGVPAIQRKALVKSLTVKHISTSETKTTASHRFDIKAVFNEASADWDFRQDIKGYWKLNGVKQELKSSGSGQVIKKSSWVDDGYTKADDMDGDPKKFETNDNPGGGFSETVKEDYYLKFRARIIDKKGKNLKKKSGYWIRIKGKYPRKFTKGGFD